VRERDKEREMVCVRAGQGERGSNPPRRQLTAVPDTRVCVREREREGGGEREGEREKEEREVREEGVGGGGVGSVHGARVSRYRGTSLIRNTPSVGPYRRTLPRVLWRS